MNSSNARVYSTCAVLPPTRAFVVWYPPTADCPEHTFLSITLPEGGSITGPQDLGHLALDLLRHSKRIPHRLFCYHEEAPLAVAQQLAGGSTPANALLELLHRTCVYAAAIGGPELGAGWLAAHGALQSGEKAEA